MRVDNFKLLLFETVNEGEGQNEQDKHQVELVPDPEDAYKSKAARPRTSFYTKVYHPQFIRTHKEM